jgi:hypothetical protein
MSALAKRVRPIKSATSVLGGTLRSTYINYSTVNRMTCSLGSMKGLAYSQYLKYKEAISIFLKVQAYDTNIRLQRLGGNTDISYYTFANSTEQTKYTLGRMILIQNDPTRPELYLPIEKI